MGQYRHEIPTGSIDGVNTVFYVSQPYVVGSTAVFLNGVLMERTLDDGWDETDPSTGEITLKEAPRSSGACPDVIQVFYKDTSEDSPETVITEICGTLEGEVGLTGTLLQSDLLCGVIGAETALSGTLVDDVPSQLQGVLAASDELVGVIVAEDC